MITFKRPDDITTEEFKRIFETDCRPGVGAYSAMLMGDSIVAVPNNKRINYCLDKLTVAAPKDMKAIAVFGDCMEMPEGSCRPDVIVMHGELYEAVGVNWLPFVIIVEFEIDKRGFLIGGTLDELLNFCVKTSKPDLRSLWQLMFSHRHG